MIECGACPDYFCRGCLPHNCASINCSENLCNDCHSKKCSKCNRSWCHACEYKDSEVSCQMLQCDDCSERHCMECAEKKGVNGVHWCACGRRFCDKCWMKECQRGNNSYSACVGTVSRLLLEQNRQLKQQIAK